MVKQIADTEFLQNILTAKIFDFLGSIKHTKGFPKKGRVADESFKCFVRMENGRDLFFIGSQPADPTIVQKGVSNLQHLRALLRKDDTLLLPEPLGSGFLNGLSYAIFPRYYDITQVKFLRFIQRKIISKALNKWILSVAQTTSQKVSPSDTEIYFKATLVDFISTTEVAEEFRRLARKCLVRLEKGIPPLHFVFAHNDLWSGNIMTKHPHFFLTIKKEDFVVIDWAGASCKGYPFYDFLRMNESIGTCDQLSREYFKKYCNIVNCEPEDALVYHFACLGRLSKNLNYFPRENFLKLLNDSTKYLLRVIGEGM